jgi:hypothetical protein
MQINESQFALKKIFSGRFGVSHQSSLSKEEKEEKTLTKT